MKKIFFMFFIVFGLCFANESIDGSNLAIESNLSSIAINNEIVIEANSTNVSYEANDINKAIVEANITAKSNIVESNLSPKIDENDSLSSIEAPNLAIKSVDFTLYGLYENADVVVKFVIYILVIFSLLTWSVLIAKVIEFWRYKKILKLDLFYTKKAIFLEDLPTLKENSFMEIFKNEAIIEMEKSKKLNGTKSRIRTNFEIKINSIITNAKNLTSILASIGSSAPFIGLFGTVWGIMNSFIGIAGSNDTGLDVVAPGIAEALFATAFGLAAAIPAVLFYNYIIRKTAKFANEIDEIATAVYLIADRTLDKKW